MSISFWYWNGQNTDGMNVSCLLSEHNDPRAISRGVWSSSCEIVAKERWHLGILQRNDNCPSTFFIKYLLWRAQIGLAGMRDHILLLEIFHRDMMTLVYLTDGILECWEGVVEWKWLIMVSKVELLQRISWSWVDSTWVILTMRQTNKTQSCQENAEHLQWWL